MLGLTWLALGIVFCMVAIAGSVITFAVLTPKNSVAVELQKWQTLIGATIGFSGVILALLFNAAGQDIAQSNKEIKQKLSLNETLLSELKSHLHIIELNSK